MKHWFYRLALAFSVLLTATGALAQDTTPADDEARARFSAGEIAYAAARYEEALADFQRAYELSERPELLYNVGLSAERLRQDELAVECFETFLELRPNHEHADQVRTRLALLQRVSANPNESDDPDEPDDPDAVISNPDSGPSRAGPWALGITGGALVIGGTVLLAIALGDKSEIEGLTEQRTWPDIQSQVESVPRRSGAGIALIAVGGAAVVGAILWRVLTPASSVEVSAGIDRVQIRGSF